MQTRKVTGAALAATLVLMAGAGADESGRTLFIRSAVEHGDGTVTFPLYRGTSGGKRVYFIVLDTSSGPLADTLGVNRSQKLANARNTGAVQHVSGNIRGGTVEFPASVDFSPPHVVEAPAGFPPTVFQAGAEGDPGYSPLIQLADGTIVNAPQIARDDDGDGRITPLLEAADKVVSLDLVNRRVRYLETAGFANGKPVHYVSTDSTDPLAAALEDVTLAPALNDAPFPGGDGTDAARASLAAFVNGQTGRDNPERQGLNSAVAGDGDPLNVLRWTPNQGRYSPLWDVHLAAWTAGAIASGQNRRQRDWNDIEGLADHGLVTAADGGSFRASEIIVNCPIVSER
jgi:hypothetical protein